MYIFKDTFIIEQQLVKNLASSPARIIMSSLMYWTKYTLFKGKQIKTKDKLKKSNVYTFRMDQQPT